MLLNVRDIIYFYHVEERESSDGVDGKGKIFFWDFYQI